MLRAALLALLVCGAAARIYDRCNLARDLLNTYKFPRDQIATWVCIAHAESNYNTAIVGRANTDGSEDNGIFQINSRYWCSPPGTGCGVTCASLRDDDISNDVACVKKIFQETAARSGNGFTAWTTYTKSCNNGRANSFTDGCGI